MTKQFRYVSLASAMLCSVAAVAQMPSMTSDAGVVPSDYPEVEAQKKLVDNTKVIYIPGSGQTASIDSVRALITKFYVNQFRHFQDPKAPYFMFMSKDANVAMGVGGVIRMRGYADWNGSIPANGFAPYMIPIPSDPAAKKRLAATPAGTAIYLTILGKNSPVGDYMGYVEGNFNGYNGVGFRLKKAYVMFGDWTAGYATSTFSDPATQPPTIDGAGPNGEVSKTNILVRYLHEFKRGWSVAGSVEIPSSQIDDSDPHTQKCPDWVPDIAAFGQYQWDGGLSHIRLSGLLRVMTYRNLLTSSNINKVGWAAQLSSVFKIGRPVSFYAAAAVGQGCGSYLGDLSIGNCDLISEPGNPGNLYAPTSLGITAGLKYNFTSSIYACAALGELRYFPKGSIDDSTYKYGLYGALNVFWDITPRFQVGAEYLAGKRKNFNGEHGNANRIDALFQFSF